MRRGSMLSLAGLVCLASVPATGAGESVVSLEEMVREFHLDNGITLLVVENHDSPTVGVVTAFSVGAAEERPGINGVTHILEHMLFKGTTEVGTTDWEAEKAHFDRIEELTMEVKDERAKGPAADPGRIESLLEERRREMDAAKEYAVDNELWGLYEEAGGVNLNAFTSYDITAYVQSLPANRLELWMYLESERLRRPILRQFYTEVQNVLEERRLSVDSDPEGILRENLLAVAYDAHWYGYPIIGYPSDISTLTRTETQEWFRIYYAPNRLTLSIVGDVDPEKVHRMVQDYFGDIPRQDPPEPLETFDLPKKGMRRVEVEFDAEPRLMMAWHKETVPHADDAALRIIAEILGGGPSSRFRKILVEERQIAASVRPDHEMPGIRWPNLFVIDALPRAPHGAAELEAAIWEQLRRLKREPVGERELAKAKNRLRASRVRDFESNFELAVDLAYYQAATPDGWRTLVEHARALEAVTADDVQAVARKTFRRSGTIVATLVEPIVEIDPAREARGREVAARMTEALGGREKITGIRTVRKTAKLDITTPGGPLTAEGRTFYGVPDRMRSEFAMFGQTQLRGVSPSECWRTQQGAVVDLEGDDAEESRRDLERAMFLLAWAARPGDWVLQGAEADGGDVVEVVGPSGGAFTVHLDAESGLPVRVEYDGTNPMTGQPARFVEELSDFRSVDGVKRPHRIVTTVDGEPFMEATVTELEINGEIPADIFVRPTG